MDGVHFDRLVRAWQNAGTRRVLLRALATLSLGGLAAFFAPDEVDAKRRRKKARKRGKGRRRKDQKKKCKADSTATTCAGQCGEVTNNCKQTVDCGPCGCDPPCGSCETCTSALVCEACDRCCDGTCVTGECCTNAECGEGFLCLDDGSCQACDVSCTAANDTCPGTALQAALDAPGADGTVYVCPGRYTGTFILSASSTVIGAGQGDDPGLDTILDAQESGRVLEITASATSTTLRRLRLTGGSTGVDGAGIQHGGVDLTMSDCTVTRNTATLGHGGGISKWSYGTLQLTGCTVSENSAAGGSAGIDVGSGITATFTNCAITDNAAGNGGAGGIWSYSPLTLDACRVSGNTARWGGGIYTEDNVHLRHGSEVSENVAADQGEGQGGGIFLNLGTLTIEESTITGNQADGGPGAGGGVYNENGTVELISGSLSDNDPDDCVDAGDGTGCPS